MQVLSVLGNPPSLEPVASLLDGRVALVSRESLEVADGPTRYTLDSEGTWRGHGGHGGITELLDRLAPNHDYALVAGHSRPRVSTVLVGDAPPRTSGDVVAHFEDPPEADTLARLVTEAESWVTLESLVANVKQVEGTAQSGAIATFTGRVRAKDGPDDARTTHLEFDRYEEVAQDRMAELTHELESRDGVFAVRMHHRTGVIEAGEDIVFVVVLAGHRNEAFRTVRDGIDRLKDEVPIFKKEATVDEEFWVHECN